MEEEEIKPFDFGAYFGKTVEEGQQLDPTVVAHSLALFKKQNPNTPIIFSDDAQKLLSKKYGEEAGINAKQVFGETMDYISTIHDQEVLRPMGLSNWEDKINGKTDFKSEEIGTKEADPVFRKPNFLNPFQYRSYEEVADENKEYFARDESGGFTKKSLKENEDFNDVTNPWGIGFGGSNLVVSTNEWVAEHVDPSLKKKIENGEVHPESNYQDENGKYFYRELAEGEEHHGQYRNIFGPRQMYNDAFLKEAGKGLYDGFIGLVEGAGTIGYYSYKMYSAPMKYVLGNNSYDDFLNNAFNDFSAVTSRLKSTSSMEEDLGWSYNLTNFTKLAMNGIGQIAGTLGAGLVVRGAGFGISALSKAAKIGAIPDSVLSGMGSITTRALNFGIAAKAGKEEAMRHGLSKNESDALGIVSGSIMLATEFMTGSQFIPKLVGKSETKRIAGEIAKDTWEKAKASGLTLGEYVAKNPGAVKNAVFKAHHWLESAARNRMEAYAKGFTGEAIQEFSEDFSFSLVKDGYDYVTGTKSFNQDWDNVWHDLAGSFLIGGASGGISKAGMYSKKARQRDQVDDKKNGFINNEIAKGNYKPMLEALDKVFKKDGLASKIVSINRDENGHKMPVSKDKGLNSMSENQFFYNMYKAQIETAHKASQMISGVQTRQSMADKLTKYLGQDLTNKIENVHDITKGIRMAIEVEGMNMFREISLVQGQIALEAARSKSGSETKFDDVTDVRFYNGRVLAVKRTNDDEFQAPSVTEESALNQAYMEIHKGNIGKSVEGSVNNIVKLEKEKRAIEFKIERAMARGENTPYLQELEALNKENQTELDQEVTALKETLKSNGIIEELWEDFVEANHMTEFTATMRDGRREDRYLKNFKLNMLKENPLFREAFESNPDYNWEDFLIGQERKAYMEESYSRGQELMTDEVNTNSDKITETLDSDQFSFSDKIQWLNREVFDVGTQFNKSAAAKIKSFFEDNPVMVTDQDRERMNTVKLNLAAVMVEFSKVDDDYINQAKPIGLDHLFSAISSEKNADFLAEQALKGISTEAIIDQIKLLKQKFNTVTTDLDEEFDELFEDAVFYSRTKAMADLVALHQGLGKKVMDESKMKAFEAGPLEDADMFFAINQNAMFKDNLTNDSLIDTAISKMEITEANPETEFIDTGNIARLREEIKKNTRYLAGKISTITDKLSPEYASVNKALRALFEYNVRLEKLRMASDHNRGNRFQRDYEVKQAVMENALIHLSLINAQLQLGFENEIAELSKSQDITSEEGKLAVDEQYKIYQELEIKASEAVQMLDNAGVEKLFDAMGLLDLPFQNFKDGSSFRYLFMSNHEDQKSPFNPVSSNRDMAESAVNYLMLLARGNLREYWNHAHEVIDSKKLKEEFIPSQEQLFIAKQIFTKLASEEPTNVDKFLSMNFTDGRVQFISNAIYVRGIAGAGKSTMAVNFSFDVYSRFMKDQGIEKIGLTYTAPNQAQVDTIGASLSLVPGAVATPFEIDEFIDKMNRGDGLEGINAIVVDEATAMDQSLLALTKALDDYNKKFNRSIKLMWIGDEFQNTSDYLRFNGYSNQAKNFMERTVPLTTPYRSGKVESFDIQSGHRQLLSALAMLSEIDPSKKVDFFVPGMKEKVTITGQDDINLIYEELKSNFLAPKRTMYVTQNGVIKKGVRGVNSLAEIVELFADDLSKTMNTPDNDTRLIVTPLEKDQIILQVQKSLGTRGIKMSENELQKFIVTSKESQGLQFKRVYVGFEADGSKEMKYYINDLRSMYVAESREKEGLVMLSGSLITSELVAKEESIPTFPPLNFNEKNGEDLIGDSLALYENNQHIADVVEDLAGKKNLKNQVPPTEQESETLEEADSTENQGDMKNDPDETDPNLEKADEVIKTPPTDQDLNDIAKDILDNNRTDFDFSQFKNICE
jgi:hypothetical protein